MGTGTGGNRRKDLDADLPLPECVYRISTLLFRVLVLKAVQSVLFPNSSGPCHLKLLNKIPIGREHPGIMVHTESAHKNAEAKICKSKASQNLRT